ncbi:TetR/AcrR family transcriptional regulator [Rubrivirga sp. IMCC43871]|uniref:TetR/AcrR family transcriptional regulator n=1 Tax=Rubrivirga sp. IMCC43871 TaxID=3391575 RepID=UPI00398FABAB
MPEADAATRDRILEAAHRVFLRRSVAAARTQEIADEAGVNKALLHYYFRTKEGLADAVFLRAAAGLFPQLLGALASDLPLRDKLQAAINVEMDALEGDPFLPGYILCELRTDPARLSALLHETLPVEQVRAQVFGVVQAQIDAEVAAGRLRPITSQQLVVTLMSLLLFPHAAAHMLEVAAGLGADAQAALSRWRRENLADFVLRGFAPDPA